MNARLLTEQGKQRARNDWLESNPTWDDEHHLLIAQDAKSIRVDRQMLAGYLNGMCEDRAHGLEQPRRHCPYCMTDLMFAGREGNAPWEEKDAVHTTRKTPRTIPPD